MQSQIIRVADQMFPEPALPYPVLTATTATLGAIAWRGNVTRKPRLDRTPAFGEIRVPIRQGPDHVQFVGQDNGGINLKGPAFATDPRGIAQKADM